MSTLSGFRRRGYTPASIRNFCDMVGTNRSDGVVDFGMLEFSIRQDLDANAPRAMCVLRPLKVVITNYPEDKVDMRGSSQPLTCFSSTSCLSLRLLVMV
jgi:glutaminyl-tRNA synthetase